MLMLISAVIILQPILKPPPPFFSMNCYHAIELWETLPYTKLPQRKVREGQIE